LRLFPLASESGNPCQLDPLETGLKGVSM